MGKDRIAVSDRRGQPGPDRNAGTDQCAECDGDDDLQDVAGDDCRTGLCPQYAAGIRPAEVSAAILADIRMIKYLADDQCERYGAQQIADQPTGERLQ